MRPARVVSTFDGPSGAGLRSAPQQDDFGEVDDVRGYLLVLAMALAPLATAGERAGGSVDPYGHLYRSRAGDPGPGRDVLRQLASASRKDAGLVRFEILQRTAPAREFVILESWKAQQAFDAHVASAHHKQFREKVTPHLIAPIRRRFSAADAVGPSHRARRRGLRRHACRRTRADPRKGLAALTALSGATRKDAGNLRFDVVHQKNRTNHFTVVEVWKDQPSNDAHELAAHTQLVPRRAHADHRRTVRSALVQAAIGAWLLAWAGTEGRSAAR